MVEAAGSLKPKSVGTGVADGGAGVEGVVLAADGGGADGDGVEAPAVVDATWSGESCSVGGLGVAWRGDTPSHINVGVEGDWTKVVVGLVACRVADDSVAVTDSDSGERVNLFSSSWSQSNSNLFCHGLIFLAGGDCVSGEGGVGGAGDGVESAGEG